MPPIDPAVAQTIMGCCGPSATPTSPRPARTSPLLRTGPPAHPASVLRPSQVMLLGPLPLPTSVDVSGTPSHVPRKGRRSGSRRLHAGHRLASTRVPASLIPAAH